MTEDKGKSNGGAPSAPETAAPEAGPDKSDAGQNTARSYTEEQAEAALAAFEAEQKNETVKGGGDKKQAKEDRGNIFSILISMVRGFFSGFFKIRNQPTVWGRLFMASTCLGLLLLAWYLASRPWWGPDGDERLLNKMAMGSPEEVFGSFHSLWFDRALMRNLIASLWRVFQGFGLAIIVGVPLGILGGTFRRIDAFFAPVSIFGRNVPIAALVPLTMLFFGIDEGQKIAFIFLACVAFIMFDASRAVADVKEDYLDTAYTLGASRFQVLTKVLIPLAMPAIVNSLRLMLGLAFGYIILAEMVNAEAGIGKLILISQRRGPKEHVYLILFIITIVAFALNYLIVGLQRWLFAWKYSRR